MTQSCRVSRGVREPQEGKRGYLGSRYLDGDREDSKLVFVYRFSATLMTKSGAGGGWRERKYQRGVVVKMLGASRSAAENPLMIVWQL